MSLAALHASWPGSQHDKQVPRTVQIGIDASVVSARAQGGRSTAVVTSSSPDTALGLAHRPGRIAIQHNVPPCCAGAPLPVGADRVVPIEQTEPHATGSRPAVTIKQVLFSSTMHILPWPDADGRGPQEANLAHACDQSVAQPYKSHRLVHPGRRHDMGLMLAQLVSTLH